MESLDTLKTFGSELTTEQLADVDGGFVALAVAGICFLVGLAVGASL